MAASRIPLSVRARAEKERRRREEEEADRYVVIMPDLDPPPVPPDDLEWMANSQSVVEARQNVLGALMSAWKAHKLG